MIVKHGLNYNETNFEERNQNRDFLYIRYFVFYKGIAYKMINFYDAITK